jgi:caffeoyl-CoA O-methyltransferase
MEDKFIALTPQMYRYVAEHRSADDELLEELRRETAQLGDLSGMQISPDQGTLLGILAAASGAQTALEVGTFTGYSAICVARALPPQGRLICCDQSAEWTAIARRYWQRAGLQDKIELRLGDARQTLAALGEEIDFAFVDADKPGYDAYYELILPRLRPNGLILFDNTLREGRIATGELESEGDRALHALNDKLAADTRVQSVLLPIADGLTVCRKL